MWVANLQKQRLLDFLGNQPDAYLVEMQQWLYETYDVKISLSSISGFLKRAGWIRKKLQSKAGERNELLRRDRRYGWYRLRDEDVQLK